MTPDSKQKMKTTDMVYIAVFAVLMAICSWISIPTVVPFTLQTFAVFLAMSVLGGKRGCLSILVYLLLGAVGIPVFSGFQSGVAVIFGRTGGYIIGFVFAALIMWAMEMLPWKKTWVQILSMLLGMITYYFIGTIWFMEVYAKDSGEIGLMAVLGWCVFPFIVPDLIKMALALALSKRIKGIMKIS